MFLGEATVLAADLRLGRTQRHSACMAQKNKEWHKMRLGRGEQGSDHIEICMSLLRNFKCSRSGKYRNDTGHLIHMVEGRTLSNNWYSRRSTDQDFKSAME